MSESPPPGPLRLSGSDAQVGTDTSRWRQTQNPKSQGSTLDQGNPGRLHQGKMEG